ncbi:unnamed protein product [Leuciscus chuanchicus]
MAAAIFAGDDLSGVAAAIFAVDDLSGVAADILARGKLSGDLAAAILGTRIRRGCLLGWRLPKAAARSIHSLAADCRRNQSGLEEPTVLLTHILQV